MSGNSYSSNRYRGRRSGNAGLKVLVALLAVLFAAGVIFYFLLGKYIQYTDDGVRLNLPWAEEEPQESTPPPEVSDMVIYEEEEPSPPPVVPEEEEPLRLLEAVEVTPEEVTAGTAADKVKAAGGNALVVEVKVVEGNLAWSSSSRLAQDAELSGDPAFNEAVAALDGADELYLVARMNCFEDLWMCVHDKSMALTTQSGNLWYDTYGMPWLSPANAAAREYLTGLCLELAALGFDEILLERAGFPPKGKLSAVVVGENYPAEGRDEIVSRWLEELTAALEETDVRLSVYVTEEELAQENGKSGWTAAGLAAADRIWLEVTEPEADAALLAEAGMENPAERLVRVCGEIPEDRSGSWVLMSK